MRHFRRNLKFKLRPALGALVAPPVRLVRAPEPPLRHLCDVEPHRALSRGVGGRLGQSIKKLPPLLGGQLAEDAVEHDGNVLVHGRDRRLPGALRRHLGVDAPAPVPVRRGFSGEGVDRCNLFTPREQVVGINVGSNLGKPRAHVEQLWRDAAKRPKVGQVLDVLLQLCLLGRGHGADPLARFGYVGPLCLEEHEGRRESIVAELWPGVAKPVGGFADDPAEQTEALGPLRKPLDDHRNPRGTVRIVKPPPSRPRCQATKKL